jgi:hypothetical protein
VRGARYPTRTVVHEPVVHQVVAGRRLHANGHEGASVDRDRLPGAVLVERRPNVRDPVPRQRVGELENGAVVPSCRPTPIDARSASPPSPTRRRSRRRVGEGRREKREHNDDCARHLLGRSAHLPANPTGGITDPAAGDLSGASEGPGRSFIRPKLYDRARPEAEDWRNWRPVKGRPCRLGSVTWKRPSCRRCRRR